MGNLKYHIFRVYDYKGGELNTSLNLLKEDFIGKILSKFIDCDEIEFNKETPDILKLSKDIIGNIPEFSLYAGGSSQVAQFFITDEVSADLISLDLVEFVKDNILDIVKHYCENEYYNLTEDDIISLTK